VEYLVLRGRTEKVAQWELYNLYSSPDIIRQIKSRRMRWTGHRARMGEGRNLYMVWWESPKEEDHLKDQGVDGRMGSKWTLGTLVGGCAVDSPGLEYGLLAGCVECGVS
jgi:hypothetical protein